MSGIRRYTLAERVVHWTSAITYCYALATGLAFYSPHLYWIAIVLGGAPTSRFWHPIIALVFLASLAWMLKCVDRRHAHHRRGSRSGAGRWVATSLTMTRACRLRPLQSRPEVFFLGDGVGRPGACGFGRDPVVSGNRSRGTCAFCATRESWCTWRAR